MNSEPVLRNVSTYNETTNFTALNLTDADWMDKSTTRLIKNLPTSNSLKEPIDFNTIERNYTYDWLYGQ